MSLWDNYIPLKFKKENTGKDQRNKYSKNFHNDGKRYVY